MGIESQHPVWYNVFAYHYTTEVCFVIMPFIKELEQDKSRMVFLYVVESNRSVGVEVLC